MRTPNFEDDEKEFQREIQPVLTALWANAGPCPHPDQVQAVLAGVRFDGAEAVQKHREAYPDMDVFSYPAGHAFNRDVDPSHYDAASAQLALERTLKFFGRHLQAK